MVDPNDYLEQKKVYTFKGGGKWKILTYIPGPSLVMVKIDDSGFHSTLSFGIREGLIAKHFNEIPGETVNGKDKSKLTSHHTVSKEGLDIGSPTDGQ